MSDDTKLCRKCGADRPLSMFTSRADSPDGLRSQCRECVSAYNRQWAAENPERMREHARATHRRRTLRDPEGLANIRPVCADCNKRKKNTWPFDRSA